MNTATKTIDNSLGALLEKRKQASLYRRLQVNDGMIDFCSNDYLSFSRSRAIQEKVRSEMERWPISGATGSRSISGNTHTAEHLEQYLAAFHQAEAGLLFNSGYDANLGLFSCIARKEDVLITDELIHASIIDGCRLSYATRLRFDHNDVDDLEKKLQKARSNMAPGNGHIFVAVESVYSMDGDSAPLPAIAALCRQYNAQLIVDEAHATGIFGSKGRGLVSYFGLENEVFARIHTFGKAMGAHGAVIVGSQVLRDYLINFARSFIFTTALPLHSLMMIKCAYEQLQGDQFSIQPLHALIDHFKQDFATPPSVYLIGSNSPVQSLVIPGTEKVRNVASMLQAKGFDIRPIVSPSVPAGKERLRISLHLHNTHADILALKQLLQQILFS